MSELAVLYTEQAIRERVKELGEQISRDYRDVEELHLIGILKGAFIFLADLSRRLTIPRHVDFVALASYDQGATSGEVRLIMDLRESVRGKHLLVVDDIVDSGKTLAFLVKMLAAHAPASLKTCVLTRKSKSRGSGMEVDYVGFEIPDVWVVGYGLDYADRHRTLPHIAVVQPDE